MPHRSLRSHLPIAIALAGSLFTMSAAAAADLDFPAGYGYGSGDVPPPQTKIEFGTGWYIRGDIGATRGPSVLAGQEPYDYGALSNPPYNNAADFTAGVFDGPGTTAPGLGEGSNHLGYVATLGGGYEFNRWFRADATFDFVQPTKSSYQGETHPCVTSTYLVTATTENLQSANCTPTLSASLREYVVLVNGYVDLGHWWIATPYVGAGVGISFGHANASSTYIQGNNAPYAGVQYTDALSGTSFTQNWDRQQSANFYNFAYALMGGVAFDVYPHTKLDIGYRYLHLGNVLGTDIYEHQVRAGLRYMIDN